MTVAQHRKLVVRSRILIFTPAAIEEIIDFDFVDESADSQINRRLSLMAEGNEALFQC